MSPNKSAAPLISYAEKYYSPGYLRPILCFCVTLSVPSHICEKQRFIVKDPLFSFLGSEAKFWLIEEPYLLRLVYQGRFTSLLIQVSPPHLS